jgi:hypothetical protein
MYDYSKKMFTGRVKPIRIIGDPDNQRPDNWRSTVIGSLIRKWKEEQRCPGFLGLNNLRAMNVKLWRHVDKWMGMSVSEKPAASFFRVCLGTSIKEHK